ncbi:alpha/beta hydrolase [Sandaracinus amylolyticus]|uniref:alpha/beta hydrolase n=1 Tax=Sandaracinus amylolyticus TaxID=927083 RepID=UPI001F2B43CF|nr:dienelactone hydrolase family protein [Sandaracinus amylolyticus]UJR79016.1 Phospholipase/carboxylesterase [Sandaracinus amylolyticus]
MKIERLGDLHARIVGESEGEGPVVVLLHGFGAPGEDLVGLAPYLQVPRGTRFVFPEAPLDLSRVYGMGRAWWMIDMVALDRMMREGRARDLANEVPEGIDEARTKVVSMLDAIEQRLRPSSLILGGFSQGAMLSVDVALHDARPLAGLALFSGTLLSQSIWTPKMASRTGLPVMQSHGAFDPILPFPNAELLRDRMKEAGVDVDFVPFRGGHEIPPVALQRFGALAHRVLAPRD